MFEARDMHPPPVDLVGADLSGSWFHENWFRGSWFHGRTWSHFTNLLQCHTSNVLKPSSNCKGLMFSRIYNCDIGNWILNIGQIVPLSESHCSLFWNFCKMYFRFHFSGVWPWILLLVCNVEEKNDYKVHNWWGRQAAFAPTHLIMQLY